MAFNKSKALESALKYLNQGKVAQAIGEYQQILRHDPKDQATLMTVGDLYARQGEMPNAIEYFERLAQVYLGDGFNSKAIAIYKKIAKLAPNELAPLERLADLYVQQGVLSEARPLFLQIAEAYLKANRAPKAVEVLHRLLDVEPENPRVQMRLAELYNAMGQKKEAAQTYLNYGQRLFDRGETDEAEKLAERAIAVDGSNADALLLKGKSLVALNRTDEAIRTFEKHPDADAGGEVTNLIVDMELKAGQVDSAADRARNQLVRGSAHCGLLLHVVDALIDDDKPGQALPLLSELRDPMIEAGEQEKFLKALTDASQRMPGKPEPLETMADFCRHTSDPFRLSSALTQLVDIYAATGDYAHAEVAMQELIERNKDDERLVERLNQLRARSGGSALPEPMGAPVAPPVSVAAEPEEQTEQRTLEQPSAQPVAPTAEEQLDPETQKFIAQALTDVDLFSSYGLTQKATNLLETVLERVPRHTPTIERLLDFHLGAGNERRTAELASQLEQIYTQRGDSQNAERFSELRMRFQAAAGMTADELPPAPPLPEAMAAAPATEEAAAEVVVATVPATSAPAPAAHAVAAGPAEFEIALVAQEEEAETAVAPAPPAPAKTKAVAPAPTPSAAPVSVPVAAPASAATEEVDLSDEWEAMIEGESGAETDAPPAEAMAEAETAEEPVLEIVTDAQEPAAEVRAATHEDLDPPVTAEAEAEIPVAHAEEHEHAPEPVPELAAEQETVTADEEMALPQDFELELVADEGHGKPHEKTTDDFINELVAEFDELEAAAPRAEHPAMASAPAEGPRKAPEAMASAPASISAAPVAPAKAAKTSKPAAVATPAPPAATAPPPAASVGADKVPQPTAESLNQLSEVFQEFRSEFGEMGAEEDEDLETHYNLGIAYREMGLLDEAIGEFQKVAKAIQKGKPFKYAMNCSTLLALSFSDKGEPKIAALWYQRALDVPGLDQEAVQALRYDLGVALEMAGDSDAALDSFRQVYAMNIDYRDVADRISVLQKR
jgi:pilus assembly protein FimV